MFKVNRIVFLLVLIGFSTPLLAQRVQGIVKDMLTRQSISNAQIITSKATILTSDKGEFELTGIKLGELISIRIMGYETTEVQLKSLTDTLIVFLKYNVIPLKEVQINTSRNYKLDSLNLRKQYAKAFNNKGLQFADLFIGKDPNYNSPFAFTNPRSTASLVSLNVLQVISFFGKNKSTPNRLKETLLRDEELNYIDHIFSKEKVKSITKLTGEELIKFMNDYRPSVLTLRKMTDYELTLYIKKSYVDYLRAKL